MTRIQQSLTINAPVEKIVAYVADPRRLPEWNQIVTRVWDVQETPEAVGTTWKLAAKVAGSEHEVTARISRYEPPRRLELELVGGVHGIHGLKASMEVEVRPLAAGSSAASPRSAPPETSAGAASAPDHALVICTLSIQFPWLMGGAALGKTISPIISDQLRRGLLNLKRALRVTTGDGPR